MDIFAFRKKVTEEAREQRKLRAEGKKVPTSLTKQTRLSSVITMFFTGLAIAILVAMFRGGDALYVGLILFSAIFFVIGLFQLVTGRNISAPK